MSISICDVFIVLLALGGLWLLPDFGRVAFIVYTLALCAVFTAVCWLRGEPRAWRWGEH